jgi:hypothetical protein
VSYLDVGPTTDLSLSSRPFTDNRIDFEDLIVFASNYGLVSSPAAIVADAGGAGAQASGRGATRARSARRGRPPAPRSRPPWLMQGRAGCRGFRPSSIGTPRVAEAIAVAIARLGSRRRKAWCSRPGRARGRGRLLGVARGAASPATESRHGHVPGAARGRPGAALRARARARRREPAAVSGTLLTSGPGQCARARSLLAPVAEPDRTFRVADVHAGQARRESSWRSIP